MKTVGNLVTLGNLMNERTGEDSRWSQQVTCFRSSPSKPDQAKYLSTLGSLMSVDDEVGEPPGFRWPLGGLGGWTVEWLVGPGHLNVRRSSRPVPCRNSV